MRERRSRNRLVSQINVVPYIDVMLVLLVIFMVTAPMMNPSQIDLPQVGQSAQPAVVPLEVIIKKDSSLAYRDHAGDAQETRTTQGELIALLQARQGSRAEQAVVVSADKNVRYDDVVQIMDVLQQQHIKKVGLLTQLRAQ